MKSLSKRILQTLKRPIVLTALVLLPLGWSAVDAFAKDHAFLINASPSLPNWAFWLDKHAPIDARQPDLLRASGKRARRSAFRHRAPSSSASGFWVCPAMS